MERIPESMFLKKAHFYCSDAERHVGGVGADVGSLQ
jgi:hypothetical protein